MAELASVINDGPITHVSADGDAPTALAPAHFLRGGLPTTSLASIKPVDELGPNGRVDGEELRAAQKMRTSYFRGIENTS